MPFSARGGGRELALFAEIFGFAEIFEIIRFTVHDRYLVPGTWYLMQKFPQNQNFLQDAGYQVAGTYYVL